MDDTPVTDDELDARLHAAGAAWRTANSAAVRPRPVAAEPARAPRRGRWYLAAAAAVVTAGLVTGGVFAFRNPNTVPDGGGRPAAALRGTVWAVVDDRTGRTGDATMSIDASGHLVADDTCQVIGATVRADAGTLHITKRSIRFKGCTDSVGEITFTPYLKSLAGQVGYRIDAKTLKIGRSLRLRPTSTPAPTLDVPTLVGANWILLRARNSHGTSAALPRTGLRIDDRGRFVASDGCNELSGTARGGSGQIRFVRGFQTQVGCATADVVDAVLTDTVQATVVGARLTITKAGVGELIYRWNPTSAATDAKRLTDVTWHLEAIGATPAVGIVTVRFAHNRLNGRDGCGPLAGDAVIQRGTAVITRGAALGATSTCSKPVRDQASTVNSFLQTGTFVWAIRDGKLLIYGGGAQAYALIFEA